MFKIGKIDLKAIIDFLVKYQRQMFTILGIICIIIGFVVFILIRYKTISMDILERTSVAENLFYSERFDEALDLIDELLSKYPRHKHTVRAALFKAYILYNRKDFHQAKEMFLRVINEYRQKKFLPMAYLGVGHCEENLRNYDKALEIYERFINEFPDNFLAPKIYESIARIYEIKNSSPKVVEYYEKMLINYPGSYWSTIAEEKLKSLGAR